MEPEETGQGLETGTEEIPVAEAQEESTGGDSLNPAWNELLEVVPSQLHSLVTPHLQKWDQNFQSKINEVHSKYDPYKDFLEQNVEPDQINYALQLQQAIDQRPLEVIKALNEYAKSQGLLTDEPEQQGQVDESEIPNEILQHPEIVKMQQMVNTMAQAMLEQNQAKAQAEEDQKLQAEIKTLKETHGEFDVDWVVTKALQDANAGKSVKNLEPYVKQYQDFEQSILAKSRQPAPKVLAPGGIAPNNQVDVKALDEKGRRDFVTQMLQAAAQQGQ